jgi:hypothetical protein
MQKTHGLYNAILLCNIAFLFSNPIQARSVHRPEKNYGAYITVKPTNIEKCNDWVSVQKIQKYPKEYALVEEGFLESKYLQFDPLINRFNKKRFYEHMLPKQILAFRNGKGFVDTEILQKKADHLIKELQSGKKKHFKDFSMLTYKDFNFKTQSGMLILKYKDYPFVLKLFIEHPHTIVQPFSKSFQTACQFVLGGNLKHLTGFTRIDNLLDARAALKKDPEYSVLIDFPRKWYYLPTDENWLKVTWHNKHKKSTTTVKFPSVYGLIADFIEVDKDKEKKYKALLRQKTMEVVNYLHYIIDAHEGNFIFEKNSDKIVIIDTEHFPTLTGLKKEMKATSYLGWYTELMNNFVKTHFLQNKQTQIKAQNK